MARLTRALLLSPDRSEVVMTHDAVRTSVGAPLDFSETYPETPTLSVDVFACAASEAWGLGRVLRLDYDDGTAEAWRVRRARRTYTGRGLWPVELDPLWLDLGSRTLVAEIKGTSVATPRLSLISRSPASCLGVAFDPLSGAPATASGAPMFVVGQIDARYQAERVDVSVVGGSPLDVLEAVAADLRCLWRARLVLSGDSYADEVYEVDLYAPSEPADVPAQAFEVYAAAKIPGGSVGDVGNAPGMARPNVSALALEDDASGLVTALVPLAESAGEDAAGVERAVWRYRTVGPYQPGTGIRTVQLGGRHGEPAAVVPYDGALDGLLLTWADDTAPNSVAFRIVASRAPDEVDVATDAGENPELFSYHRFTRGASTAEAGADAPRRPVVQIANQAAVEAYGVLSEARTFGAVAAHANEFENGACDAEAGGSPVRFDTLGANVVPWEWTDDEASVAHGERSPKWTAATAGDGVVATALPLYIFGASKPVSVWVSMRVQTGRVQVTVHRGGAPVPNMQPASIVVEALGGLESVLTTVEFASADGADGSVEVLFTALDAGTVWVVDALTVVQAPAVQPYRTLMGPNALWVRAWDDLQLAPRRVTTATATVLDAAALGLPGEDLSPGAWVRVRPDGREPVEMQVLESRWEQDLAAEGQPGGLAAERQLRLGPPPYDLVQRLSSPPSRARAPEGSKRAPLYAFYDRGPSASGRGRTIEPASDDLGELVTLTRTLCGVSYEVTAYRVSPYAAGLVRRDPSRPGELALHLTSPPD